MSTPFQFLPSPGAIAWSDAPESAIGAVWSPWPAPSIATLKRSNTWPPPQVYEVTWWAPPSIVHLAPADAVTEVPSKRFGRLRRRLSAAWRRLRS